MPPTSLTAFETNLAEKFPDAETIRADVLIDQNAISTPINEKTSLQSRNTPIISTTNTIAVNDILLYNSLADVRKVESTSTTQTFGTSTAVQFADNTQKTDIEFDPNTGQYILIYRDRTVDGLRSHLVSVAADGTMTVSADFEIYGDNHFYPAGIYHHNAQRLIASWTLSSTNTFNYSIGTISGNNISWTAGTSQPRSGGGDQTANYNTLAEIPNTNYFVHNCTSISDGRTSYATLWELSSGGAIEHDRQRINSSATNQGRHYARSIAYIPYGGNHFIVTAGDENGDAGQGTSYVYRVDITNQTIVPDLTQYSYDTSASVTQQNVTYDPSTQCWVIIYRDINNSNQGHYVIGQLTGNTTTPTISYGSVQTFQNSIMNPSVFFNPQTDKVIASYVDVTSSGAAKIITGRIRPATMDIEWDTPDTVSTSSCDFPTIGFNTNDNTFIIAYEDVTAGDSFVQPLQFAGTTTTTNALQWVGVAKTVSPNVELFKQGDVVTGLSLSQGLPVYVNYDGTLTQTPNEDVYLGTYGQIGFALTSTSMVVTHGGKNG